MKLRGIEFGEVLGGSGVDGFFGEGYWFHKPLKPIGLDFRGMTFVSKTATLLLRQGNMPLTKRYTPRNPYPKSISSKPMTGSMLNAIGLSNPGLGALLGTGQWQKLTKPFMISIMPVAPTPEKRLEELRIMIDMLKFAKDDFSSPFGVQINLSSPNSGNDPKKLIKESAEALDIAKTLGVPIMPKYSIASAPIKVIMELNDHPGCDAICVSNTLPFGWEGIDWQKVWGRKTSPLQKFGGGGLSGPALRPLVCEWIRQLREAGFTKPINGGGGIMSPKDVDFYNQAGASSIFLGTVASLRPWRVKAIIRRAKSLDWS